MKKSVTAIVFSHDKKEVLVIKRRDIPIWVLPGGGLEPLETPEEGVVRELKEETGLTCTIERKVGEYSAANHLTSYCELFVCTHPSGSLKTGNETKSIGYFRLDALPEPFFPLHAKWIQDALKKDQNLIQEKMTYFTYKKVIWYFFRHPLIILRYLLTRLGLHLNDWKTD